VNVAIATASDASCSAGAFNFNRARTICWTCDFRLAHPAGDGALHFKR
jgi:hypothetical protein